MTNATLRALYVLAADYHSGQWSRGYRLASRAARIMRSRGIEATLYINWENVRQSPEYAKYEPMAEQRF